MRGAASQSRRCEGTGILPARSPLAGAAASSVGAAVAAAVVVVVVGSGVGGGGGLGVQAMQCVHGPTECLTVARQA